MSHQTTKHEPTRTALILFLTFVYFIAGVACERSHTSGVTLKVLGAPPGSELYVDGALTGTHLGDGTIFVQGLKAGAEHEVRITHQMYEDFNTTVKGKDGEVLEVKANLTTTATNPDVGSGLQSPGATATP